MVPCAVAFFSMRALVCFNCGDNAREFLIERAGLKTSLIPLCQSDENIGPVGRLTQQ